MVKREVEDSIIFDDFSVWTEEGGWGIGISRDTFCWDEVGERRRESKVWEDVDEEDAVFGFRKSKPSDMVGNRHQALEGLTHVWQP